jgi:CRP/FNR family transcriptional regulator, nitrogen oxide reductase regulator
MELLWSNQKKAGFRPVCMRRKPEARQTMTLAEIVAATTRLKPRFLDGLAPGEVKAVLSVAKHRRYLANSVVSNQGHPADYLFLLLNGRARYFFMTPNGQKTLLLWVPPGEIFGSAAMAPKAITYLASVETVINSNLLAWDRATIRQLAGQYPRLLENALLIGFDYMVGYRALHVSISFHNARQRLANVLVNLATGMGHEVPGGIELDIKNEELANEANVTPFTASRLLSEWQRSGLVVKNRGKVLLRSPELLSQMD